MRRFLPSLSVLFAASLAHAGLQLTVGASPGLVVPFDGNIRNYQLAPAGGIDFRLTGFQPVVGLGLSAGYTSITGPYRDSLGRDSSTFRNHYVPAVVSLVTDFSSLMARPAVLPYLKLGIGPCYWDIRKDGNLLQTLDSTSSRQWDYDLQAAIGVEKQLGRIPLALFAEVSADYITSTHFAKYGYDDQDDVFAVFRLGLRFHLR